MDHIREEIRVEAPVEHVWAYLCDTSHWQDWIPRQETSDFSGPYAEVGTTYVSTMKMMGFEWKQTNTVLEVEPLKLIHEHTDDQGSIDTYFRLEPDGDATRVIIESDYEMPGHLPGFLKNLMTKSFFERQMRHMLGDFKALAEATSLCRPDALRSKVNVDPGHPSHGWPGSVLAGHRPSRHSTCQAASGPANAATSSIAEVVGAPGFFRARHSPIALTRRGRRTVQPSLADPGPAANCRVHHEEPAQGPRPSLGTTASPAVAAMRLNVIEVRREHRQVLRPTPPARGPARTGWRHWQPSMSSALRRPPRSPFPRYG